MTYLLVILGRPLPLKMSPISCVAGKSTFSCSHFPSQIIRHIFSLILKPVNTLSIFCRTKRRIFSPVLNKIPFISTQLFETTYACHSLLFSSTFNSKDTNAQEQFGFGFLCRQPPKTEINAPPPPPSPPPPPAPTSSRNVHVYFGEAVLFSEDDCDFGLK